MISLSPSLISMDPVQTDLQRLGVKPPDPADYNIHTPPFPGPGEHRIGIIDCKENREKENINYNLSFVNRSFVRITTCKNFDMKNTVRDSFYRWAINCLHLNISEKHPGYRWAETGDISSSTRSVWQSHVFHLSAHSPGDHDATVLARLSA